MDSISGGLDEKQPNIESDFDSYLSLTVTRIIQETEDCRTYLLSEATGREIKFTPGQFLTFPLMIDGEEVRRSYSICTAPFELPAIGITVKRTKDGLTSNFFIENVKEGDVLKAFPPLGKFTWEPEEGKKSELFLIGAGSGITPLMSILKTTLFTETDSRVTLLYGNRSEESIIFKKDLDDLEKYYKGRLKVLHFLTQPSEDGMGNKGRIDRQSVKGFYPGSNAQCFICGPDDMIKNVINALRDMGVEASRIHTEYYTITITQDPLIDESEIKTRNVTIIFEGKEHVVTVSPYDSILQSALEQGLDLPNSCQIGQCSSCRARLISGKINLVEQSALEDWEIKEGYCLTCVGFPMSDDIVIDYDATARF